MRIFNTYGPRMHPNDGRVVSNFIVQALKGENITVYGDGYQTRSFCYVDEKLLSTYITGGNGDLMPYSDMFKRKMVQRLSGPNAISARALSKQVDVPQTTLSKWLRNAGIKPKR